MISIFACFAEENLNVSSKATVAFPAYAGRLPPCRVPGQHRAPRGGAGVPPGGTGRAVDGQGSGAYVAGERGYVAGERGYVVRGERAESQCAMAAGRLCTPSLE